MESPGGFLPRAVAGGWREGKKLPSPVLRLFVVSRIVPGCFTSLRSFPIKPSFNYFALVILEDEATVKLFTNCRILSLESW